MTCNNTQPDNGAPRLKLYVPPEPDTKPITWRRTIHMVGTVRLIDPAAPWDDVQSAIDMGDMCFGAPGEPILVYVSDERDLAFLESTAEGDYSEDNFVMEGGDR